MHQQEKRLLSQDAWTRLLFGEAHRPPESRPKHSPARQLRSSLHRKLSCCGSSALISTAAPLSSLHHPERPQLAMPAHRLERRTTSTRLPVSKLSPTTHLPLPEHPLSLRLRRALGSAANASLESSASSRGRATPTTRDRDRLKQASQSQLTCGTLCIVSITARRRCSDLHPDVVRAN